MTQANDTQTTMPNEWVSLVDIYVQFGGPEPRRVEFPTGEKREARGWGELYGQIASWLVRQGKLHEELAMEGGAGRYYVSASPNHYRERFADGFELPNGFWLEVGGNPQLVLDRTILMLERFDVEPENVKVMLEKRDDDHWFVR